MNNRPISRTRLWTFRLIAVVAIPLAFLLCLEGVLRVVGFGHSAAFTEGCRVNGEEYVCPNPRFIERFFPPDLARQPVAFAFPREKPAATFRIVVLGASAAQGDPEPSYGFSRVLEILLREKYPGTRFEIVNTAITATNSHVVRPVAEEMSRFQPDLGIVYLGNNEVVGPFGAGTVFSPLSPSLPLIRAGIALKSTRLGQAMTKIVEKVTADEKPGQWQGMQMFMEKQVAFGTPALETVYEHFGANLQDIVSSFRQQGTPVILSTVAVNLKDFPPLASRHHPALRKEDREVWEGLYARGRKSYRAGDADAARNAFLEAAKLDDRYAELQFLLGKTLLELGKTAEARRHFLLARDLDSLRFRADSRINQTIESVASGFGRDVILLDAARELALDSPDGIPGEALFHEHVHLTFPGNYLLARAMAGKIASILPQRTRTKGRDLDFPEPDRTSRLLALSSFDRLRLKKLVLERLQQPPYIQQFNHEEKIRQLRRESAALQEALTPGAREDTDQLYRRALKDAPGDPWLHFNYGVFLTENGRPEAGLAQFRSAVARLPQSYKIHRRLADVLIATGRFREVLPHLRQAIGLIRVTADRTKLRLILAYSQARLEQYEASMDTYREALEEDPNAAATILHAMAKLKINTGALEEARTFLHEAVDNLEGEEGAGDIYFNYGYVLSQLGAKMKAREAYREAITIYRDELALATRQADRESLLVVLGRSSFAVGDIEAGIGYLRRAIEINPVSLETHLTLISALARHRRFEEARKAVDQALAEMRRVDKPAAIQRLESMKSELNRQMR